MAALDSFLARVVPRAAGVADPVARQAILDAAIEFCEDTHIVQEVIDPFTVTAGTPSYSLTLPTDTQLVAVKKAWYKTTPLTPAADAMIDNVLAYFSVNGTTRDSGTPQECFWHESQLWLFPTPDATATTSLSVRAALKPTPTATTIPDELLNNWREAIVFGALERVLGMRGTIHYDPNESAKYFARFENQKNVARIRANAGRTSGDLMVRMRPFA